MKPFNRPPAINRGKADAKTGDSAFKVFDIPFLLSPPSSSFDKEMILFSSLATTTTLPPRMT